MENLDALNMENKSTIGFPDWTELKKLFSGKLSQRDERILIKRIQEFEPLDEAAEGLKSWLEKNNYNLEDAYKWTNVAKERLRPSNINASKKFLKPPFLLILLLIGSIGLFIKSTTQSKEWEKRYKEYTQANGITGAILIKTSGKNHSIMNMRAVHLFESQKTMEAIAVIDSVEKASIIPTYSKNKTLKAFCYWSLGNIKLAESLFLEIASDTNYADARFALKLLNEAF